MRPGALSFAVLLAPWLSFSSTAALGQRLSFGVVAGDSVTNDFAPIFSEQHPTSPTFHAARKGFIVGPALEYAFTRSLSLEVNALNRLLHATEQNVLPDRSVNSVTTFPVTTWQFPTLLKYRLRARGTTPFVEAGPSFRTAGNLNGTNPSKLGITAGLGVEFQAKGWSIAPTIRYTRWRRDSHFPRVTKADQVEVLVGFRHRATDDARPFGRHLSFGVLTGTTLSPDFRPITQVVSIALPSPDPLNPNFEFVTERFSSGPRSLLIGPTAELALPRRFSVEASALYRTFRWKVERLQPDGTLRVVQRSGVVSAIWEIPVLLKHRIPLRPLRPFLGAGPAFRTFGTVDEPRYGLAAAVGFELDRSFLKIAPQIRYTRWATNRTLVTPADQIQVVVGVSF